MQLAAAHSKQVAGSLRPQASPAGGVLCLHQVPHLRSRSLHQHTESRVTTVVCQAGKPKGFGAVKQPVKKVTEPTPPVVDPCPCESGKNYKNCCQSAHTGVAHPATPEAALRARFSAFVKKEEAFVVSSTHPEYYGFHYNKTEQEAGEQYKEDVHKGVTQYRYADLKIVQKEPGASEDEGFVAFTYKSAKEPEDGSPIPEEAWQITNEKCRFLRVNGQWLFADYQTFSYNMNALIKEVQSEPGAAQ